MPVAQHLQRPCSRCGGRGKLVKNPCKVCHGSGRGAAQKTMEVSVPAGIDDDQSLALRGKGDAGSNGGPAGDVIVMVTVRPLLAALELLVTSPFLELSTVMA